MRPILEALAGRPLDAFGGRETMMLYALLALASVVLAVLRGARSVPHCGCARATLAPLAERTTVSLAGRALGRFSGRPSVALGGRAAEGAGVAEALAGRARAQLGGCAGVRPLFLPAMPK